MKVTWVRELAIMLGKFLFLYLGLIFFCVYLLGVFKITEKTDKTEEKLTEKTEPKWKTD